MELTDDRGHEYPHTHTMSPSNEQSLNSARSTVDDTVNSRDSIDTSATSNVDTINIDSRDSTATTNTSGGDNSNDNSKPDETTLVISINRSDDVDSSSTHFDGSGASNDRDETVDHCSAVSEQDTGDNSKGPIKERSQYIDDVISLFACHQSKDDSLQKEEHVSDKDPIVHKTSERLVTSTDKRHDGVAVQDAVLESGENEDEDRDDAEVTVDCAQVGSNSLEKDDTEVFKQPETLGANPGEDSLVIKSLETDVKDSKSIETDSNQSDADKSLHICPAHNDSVETRNESNRFDTGKSVSVIPAQNDLAVTRNESNRSDSGKSLPLSPAQIDSAVNRNELNRSDSGKSVSLSPAQIDSAVNRNELNRSDSGKSVSLSPAQNDGVEPRTRLNRSESQLIVGCLLDELLINADLAGDQRRNQALPNPLESCRAVAVGDSVVCGENKDCDSVVCGENMDRDNGVSGKRQCHGLGDGDALGGDGTPLIVSQEPIGELPAKADLLPEKFPDTLTSTTPTPSAAEESSTTLPLGDATLVVDSPIGSASAPDVTAETKTTLASPPTPKPTPIPEPNTNDSPATPDQSNLCSKPTLNHDDSSSLNEKEELIIRKCLSDLCESVCQKITDVCGVTPLTLDLGQSVLESNLRNTIVSEGEAFPKSVDFPLAVLAVDNVLYIKKDGDVETNQAVINGLELSVSKSSENDLKIKDDTPVVVVRNNLSETEDSVNVESDVTVINDKSADSLNETLNSDVEPEVSKDNVQELVVVIDKISSKTAEENLTLFVNADKIKCESLIEDKLDDANRVPDCTGDCVSNADEKLNVNVDIVTKITNSGLGTEISSQSDNDITSQSGTELDSSKHPVTISQSYLESEGALSELRCLGGASSKDEADGQIVVSKTEDLSQTDEESTTLPHFTCQIPLEKLSVVLESCKKSTEGLDESLPPLDSTSQEANAELVALSCSAKNESTEITLVLHQSPDKDTIPDTKPIESLDLGLSDESPDSYGLKKVVTRSLRRKSTRVDIDPTRNIKTQNSDASKKKWSKLHSDDVDDSSTHKIATTYIQNSADDAVANSAAPKKTHADKFTFQIDDVHLMKISGGEKLFACDICDGVYQRAFSLKRHYLRSHINYRHLTERDIANCGIVVNSNMAVSSGDNTKIFMQNSKVISSTDDKLSNQSEVIPSEPSLNVSETVTCEMEKDKTYDFCKGLVEECLKETKPRKDDCLENSTPSLLENILDSNIAKLTELSEKPEINKECDLKTTVEDCMETMITKIASVDSEIVPELTLVGTAKSADANFLLPELFRCHLCGNCFDFKADLKLHLQNHPLAATGETSPYRCNICKDTFSFKTTFLRHVATHSQPEPAARNQLCLYCEKQFGTSGILKRHITRMHEFPAHKGGKSQKMKFCPYCPANLKKKFKNLRMLLKHLTLDHSDTYHACFDCEGRFENKHLLERHNEVVHGKVTHSSVDIEGVNSSNEMSNHQFSIVLSDDSFATKEKTVSKSDAPKQSSGDFELKNTENVEGNHQDNFQYSCEICNKLFTNYVNMCRHRRLAHGKALSKSKKSDFTQKKYQKFDGKSSPKESSPQALYETSCHNNVSSSDESIVDPETLFYLKLADNIRENLLNHLDGKLNIGTTLEEEEIVPEEEVKVPEMIENHYFTSRSTRSESEQDTTEPTKVTDESPNPLREKYNFPKKFELKRRGDRFKNSYIKDMSYLDISTQLIVKRNTETWNTRVSESSSDVPNESFEKIAEDKISFSEFLNLSKTANHFQNLFRLYPGTNNAAQNITEVEQPPKAPKIKKPSIRMSLRKLSLRQRSTESEAGETYEERLSNCVSDSDSENVPAMESVSVPGSLAEEPSENPTHTDTNTDLKSGVTDTTDISKTKQTETKKNTIESSAETSSPALEKTSEDELVDAKSVPIESITQLDTVVMIIASSETETDPLETAQIPTDPNTLVSIESSKTQEQSEAKRTELVPLKYFASCLEDVFKPSGSKIVQSNVFEFSGDWVRPRTYVCSACNAKFSDVYDLQDHKWSLHPNAWVSHFEFYDSHLQSGPLDTARMSLELYKRFLKQKGVLTSAAVMSHDSLLRCTKCAKGFTVLGEFHRHILECGGDTTWMTTMFVASPGAGRRNRKWRPFGSRRRRQQGRRGMKRNIPNTPMKMTVNKSRNRTNDAETIQRMIANLPAKRSTRRAIQFKEDEIKTRSQATINSVSFVTNFSRPSHKSRKERERMLIKSALAPKAVPVEAPIPTVTKKGRIIQHVIQTQIPASPKTLPILKKPLKSLSPITVSKSFKKKTNVDSTPSIHKTGPADVKLIQTSINFPKRKRLLKSSDFLKDGLKKNVKADGLQAPIRFTRGSLDSLIVPSIVEPVVVKKRIGRPPKRKLLVTMAGQGKLTASVIPLLKAQNLAALTSNSVTLRARVKSIAEPIVEVAETKANSATKAKEIAENKANFVAKAKEVAENKANSLTKAKEVADNKAAVAKAKEVAENKANSLAKAKEIAENKAAAAKAKEVAENKANSLAKAKEVAENKANALAKAKEIAENKANSLAKAKEIAENKAAAAKAIEEAENKVNSLANAKEDEEESETTSILAAMRLAMLESEQRNPIKQKESQVRTVTIKKNIKKVSLVKNTRNKKLKIMPNTSPKINTYFLVESPKTRQQLQTLNAGPELVEGVQSSNPKLGTEIVSPEPNPLDPVKKKFVPSLVETTEKLKQRLSKLKPSEKRLNKSRTDQASVDDPAKSATVPEERIRKKVQRKEPKIPTKKLTISRNSSIAADSDSIAGVASTSKSKPKPLESPVKSLKKTKAALKTTEERFLKNKGYVAPEEMSNEPIICSGCGLQFNNHAACERHQRKCPYTLKTVKVTDEEESITPAQILPTRSYKCGGCGVDYHHHIARLRHQMFCPKYKKKGVKLATKSDRAVQRAKLALKNMFTCSCCEVKFKNRIAGKKHQRKCLAKKTAETIAKLVEDPTAHVTNEISNCSGCGEVFSTSTAYKRHQRKCVHAQKPPARVETEPEAEESSPNEPAITCSRCTGSYTNRTAYMRHRKGCIPAEIPAKPIEPTPTPPPPPLPIDIPYICKGCDVVLSSPTAFERHQRKCAFVQKQLGSEEEIVPTIVNTTSGYVCHACNRRFVYKGRFNLHKLTCKSVKVKPSDNSVKKADKKSELDTQDKKKASLDTTPFICLACNQRFVYKGRFNLHKLTCKKLKAKPGPAAVVATVDKSTDPAPVLDSPAKTSKKAVAVETVIVPEAKLTEKEDFSVPDISEDLPLSLLVAKGRGRKFKLKRGPLKRLATKRLLVNHKKKNKKPTVLRKSTRIPKSVEKSKNSDEKMPELEKQEPILDIVLASPSNLSDIPILSPFSDIGDKDKGESEDIVLKLNKKRVKVKLFQEISPAIDSAAASATTPPVVIEEKLNNVSTCDLSANLPAPESPVTTPKGRKNVNKSLTPIKEISLVNQILVDASKISSPQKDSVLSRSKTVIKTPLIPLPLRVLAPKSTLSQPSIITLPKPSLSQPPIITLPKPSPSKPSTVTLPKPGPSLPTVVTIPKPLQPPVVSLSDTKPSLSQAPIITIPRPSLSKPFVVTLPKTTLSKPPLLTLPKPSLAKPHILTLPKQSISKPLLLTLPKPSPFQPSAHSLPKPSLAKPFVVTLPKSTLSKPFVLTLSKPSSFQLPAVIPKPIVSKTLLLTLPKPSPFQPLPMTIPKPSLLQLPSVGTTAITSTAVDLDDVLKKNVIDIAKLRATVIEVELESTDLPSLRKPDAKGPNEELTDTSINIPEPIKGSRTTEDIFTSVKPKRGRKRKNPVKYLSNDEIPILPVSNFAPERNSLNALLNMVSTNSIKSVHPAAVAGETIADPKRDSLQLIENKLSEALKSIVVENVDVAQLVEKKSPRLISVMSALVNQDLCRDDAELRTSISVSLPLKSVNMVAVTSTTETAPETAPASNTLDISKMNRDITISGTSSLTADNSSDGRQTDKKVLDVEMVTVTATESTPKTTPKKRNTVNSSLVSLKRKKAVSKQLNTETIEPVESPVENILTLKRQDFVQTLVNTESLKLKKSTTKESCSDKITEPNVNPEIIKPASKLQEPAEKKSPKKITMISTLVKITENQDQLLSKETPKLQECGKNVVESPKLKRGRLSKRNQDNAEIDSPLKSGETTPPKSQGTDERLDRRKLTTTSIDSLISIESKSITSSLKQNANVIVNLVESPQLPKTSSVKVIKTSKAKKIDTPPTEEVDFKPNDFKFSEPKTISSKILPLLETSRHSGNETENNIKETSSDEPQQLVLPSPGSKMPKKPSNKVFKVCSMKFQNMKMKTASAVQRGRGRGRGRGKGRGRETNLNSTERLSTSLTSLSEQSRNSDVLKPSSSQRDSKLAAEIEEVLENRTATSDDEGKSTDKDVDWTMKGDGAKPKGTNRRGRKRGTVVGPRKRASSPIRRTARSPSPQSISPVGQRERTVRRTRCNLSYEEMYTSDVGSEVSSFEFPLFEKHVAEAVVTPVAAITVLHSQTPPNQLAQKTELPIDVFPKQKLTIVEKRTTNKAAAAKMSEKEVIEKVKEDLTHVNDLEVPKLEKGNGEGNESSAIVNAEPKPKRRLNSLDTHYFCDICTKHYYSNYNLVKHKASNGHKKKIESLNAISNPVEEVDETSSLIVVESNLKTPPPAKDLSKSLLAKAQDVPSVELDENFAKNKELTINQEFGNYESVSNWLDQQSHHQIDNDWMENELIEKVDALEKIPAGNPVEELSRKRKREQTLLHSETLESILDFRNSKGLQSSMGATDEVAVLERSPQKSHKSKVSDLNVSINRKSGKSGDQKEMMIVEDKPVMKEKEALSKEVKRTRVELSAIERLTEAEGLKSYMTSAFGGLLDRAITNILDDPQKQTEPTFEILQRLAARHNKKLKESPKDLECSAGKSFVGEMLERNTGINRRNMLKMSMQSKPKYLGATVPGAAMLGPLTVRGDLFFERPTASDQLKAGQSDVGRATVTSLPNNNLTRKVCAMDSACSPMDSSFRHPDRSPSIKKHTRIGNATAVKLNNSVPSPAVSVVQDIHAFDYAESPLEMLANQCIKIVNRGLNNTAASRKQSYEGESQAINGLRDEDSNDKSGKIKVCEKEMEITKTKSKILQSVYVKKAKVIGSDDGMTKAKSIERLRDEMDFVSSEDKPRSTGSEIISAERNDVQKKTKKIPAADERDCKSIRILKKVKTFSGTKRNLSIAEKTKKLKTDEEDLEDGEMNDEDKLTRLKAEAALRDLNKPNNYSCWRNSFWGNQQYKTTKSNAQSRKKFIGTKTNRKVSTSLSGNHEGKNTNQQTKFKTMAKQKYAKSSQAVSNVSASEVTLNDGLEPRFDVYEFDDEEFGAPSCGLAFRSNGTPVEPTGTDASEKSTNHGQPKKSIEYNDETTQDEEDDKISTDGSWELPGARRKKQPEKNASPDKTPITKEPSKPNCEMNPKPIAVKRKTSSSISETLNKTPKIDVKVANSYNETPDLSTKSRRGRNNVCYTEIYDDVFSDTEDFNCINFDEEPVRKKVTVKKVVVKAPPKVPPKGKKNDILSCVFGKARRNSNITAGSDISDTDREYIAKAKSVDNDNVENDDVVS